MSQKTVTAVPLTVYINHSCSFCFLITAISTKIRAPFKPQVVWSCSSTVNLPVSGQRELNLSLYLVLKVVFAFYPLSLIIFVDCWGVLTVSPVHLHCVWNHLVTRFTRAFAPVPRCRCWHIQPQNTRAACVKQLQKAGVTVCVSFMPVSALYVSVLIEYAFMGGSYK